MSNFTGVGIGFYAFGVFFKPLAEHFGWSRALVGWGPGVSLVVASVFAPLVGRNVDKFGMRPLLMAGSAAAGLSLALLGMMTNLWHYLFLFGVMYSIANLHMGDIVTGSTIARRFLAKRGAALGIATVGVSFGGVVMPPFAQWIMDNWDWRTAFVALGAAAVFLVFIPAMLFLRNLPPLPEENSLTTIPNSYDSERSWTRSEALSSARFWKLVFVFGLGYLPLGTMLVQQVPFLTDPDFGLSPSRAALVLSFTAAMGMVGKVFWGAMFDRMEGRWTVACSLAMQAISIWWLLQTKSFTGAIMFGLFFGLGMGGLVPMHTALRVRQFGVKHIGAIMGISSPITMLAQAGGQPLAGWIFDTTGTYRAAFYLFIVVQLTAILIVITLRDPKRPARRTEKHPIP